MRFSNIFLRAATDIFAISLGAHEGIVHLCKTRFGTRQLLFQSRLCGSRWGSRRGVRLRIRYSLVFLILHLKSSYNQ
ncbi:hypothetical protein D3C81_1569710 [compost metagenome]